MKKTISLVIALIMILAQLSACGTSPTSASTSSVQNSDSIVDSQAADTEIPVPEADPSDSTDTVESTEEQEPEVTVTYPIVDDGSITLTYFFPLHPTAASYITDPMDGNNTTWNLAVEKTGIDLEFMSVSMIVAVEKYNIMIASGEYSDLIHHSMFNYTGGYDSAIADGVYLNINDYAEEYAPNYLRAISSSEANRKDAYTDSGNLAGFFRLTETPENNWVGPLMRSDWLEDLNLEEPTTLDEWETILTAFREQKTGGVGPLEMYMAGTPICNAFVGTYGCSGYYNDYLIQVDDTVQFSAISDGYRDYLERMHSWFSAGLINEDFVTNAHYLEPDYGRVLLGKTGAFVANYAHAGTAMAEDGTAPEGSSFVMLKYPKLNDIDPDYVMYNPLNASCLKGSVGDAITTGCEYPVEAVQFMNWFYTDEGKQAANYGQEGLTFEYVDGQPQYTDMIVNNPEYSIDITTRIYLCMEGPSVIFDAATDALAEPEQLAYKEIWHNGGIYNIPSTVTLNTEEGNEVREIYGDIETQVQEFTTSVITGSSELTDATWENFVSTIKSMNVDRFVELNQAAYDRYLRRGV